MSQLSEPSEDRARQAEQAARVAAEADYARRVHRARVSAARALVTVRRRTGRPIPDEVLALAAEDY